MKKIVSSIIIGISVFASSVMLANAEQKICVALNSKNIQFDQPPIIQNDRTLVPMRAIFEAMGCDVEWEPQTRAIIAKKDDVIINLTIDNTTALINNNSYTMDVPPQIVNDRTLVPVRFIAESMNCDVDWNPDTKTVIISDNPPLTFDDNNLYNSTGNTYAKYMALDGKTYENPVYFYTSLIEVPENSTIYFTINRNPVNVRFITAYDSNKNVLNLPNCENVSQLNTEGVKYITVSANQDYAQRLVISSDNKADIFTPSEICVAIGKSISIYNKNVISKNYDEYEFIWSCDIGTTQDNNFVIEGKEENLGKHNLKLEIKNQSGKTIHTANISINVVKNTINEVSILPLGDSLTNNKPWLADVRTASENKITFLGTRGKDPLNQEGRSGFSSASYLAATEYTFEKEGVHPFWDGTRFNWKFYKEQNNINPDAVQIFLGTNGLTADPVKNSENIRKIVDLIQKDDPNMPIFIVNTMHRGPVYTKENQLDNGTIATQHLNTFNLTEYLSKTLENHENVYFIPAVFTHDSDNNYSEKDSVHPQDAGFKQIADIIYSTYCAYLD